MTSVTEEAFKRLAEIVKDLAATSAKLTSPAAKSTSPEPLSPERARLIATQVQSFATFKERLLAATAEDALSTLRSQFIGRKGSVTALLHAVGKISDQALRKKFGQTTNTLKTTLTTLINDRRTELLQHTKPTQAQKIDVTLPGYNRPLGRPHPLTSVSNQILAFFTQAGFITVHGPELESDHYNFEVLNIPANHPARATQDSFYMNHNMLLRTQTSNMQIRVAEKMTPPIAIVSPGRVYRRDTLDATHSYTFHQIEGMYIDTNVSFADLKGILIAFCHYMFGKNLKIRFRPDYFPFTEPSCEISIGFQTQRPSSSSSKNNHSAAAEETQENPNETTRWLEVLGAGLMNPIVLENAGIDPERYSGFAFGMGVERFAMIKHAIEDIRVFHENETSFLAQFATPFIY